MTDRAHSKLVLAGIPVDLVDGNFLSFPTARATRFVGRMVGAQNFPCEFPFRSLPSKVDVHIVLQIEWIVSIGGKVIPLFPRLALKGILKVGHLEISLQILFLVLDWIRGQPNVDRHKLVGMFPRPIAGFDVLWFRGVPWIVPIEFGHERVSHPGFGFPGGIMVCPRKDQCVGDMNAVSEIEKKLIKPIIVNGDINDGIGNETRQHFFKQRYRIVDQVLGLAWIVIVHKHVGQIVAILPVDDFAGIMFQRHGHGFHAAGFLAHAPLGKPRGAFLHDAASGIGR